jgi:F-type H+-transporting ATPase subunit gamma
MRMVASAKLHRTQTLTQTFLEYVDEMQKIVDCLQPSKADGEVCHDMPCAERCKRIALVSISSSSGLCGAFNSNIVKETFRKLEEYKQQGKEVLVVPIGKKIAHEIHKTDYNVLLDYYLLTDYVGNPKADAFSHAAFLVEHLIHLYAEGKIDGVEILYHHFKNMGAQIITSEWLDLGNDCLRKKDDSFAFNPDESIQKDENQKDVSLYLTEPGPSELMADLHPKMLNSKMYGILLDSVTSEHAARMLAMQTADDNAKELLQELTLLYNKSRQQAITNELIDIIGGKTAD